MGGQARSWALERMESVVWPKPTSRWALAARGAEEVFSGPFSSAGRPGAGVKGGAARRGPPPGPGRGRRTLPNRPGRRARARGRRGGVPSAGRGVPDPTRPSPDGPEAASPPAGAFPTRRVRPFVGISNIKSNTNRRGGPRPPRVRPFLGMRNKRSNTPPRACPRPTAGRPETGPRRSSPRHPTQPNKRRRSPGGRRSRDGRPHQPDSTPHAVLEGFAEEGATAAVNHAADPEASIVADLAPLLTAVFCPADDLLRGVDLLDRKYPLALKRHGARTTSCLVVRVPSAARARGINHPGLRPRPVPLASVPRTDAGAPAQGSREASAAEPPRSPR
jgi:hypothetical protein